MPWFRQRAGDSQRVNERTLPMLLLSLQRSGQIHRGPLGDPECSYRWGRSTLASRRVLQDILVMLQLVYQGKFDRVRFKLLGEPHLSAWVVANDALFILVDPANRRGCAILRIISIASRENARR